MRDARVYSCLTTTTSTIRLCMRTFVAVGACAFANFLTLRRQRETTTINSYAIRRLRTTLAALKHMCTHLLTHAGDGSALSRHTCSNKFVVFVCAAARSSFGRSKSASRRFETQRANATGKCTGLRVHSCSRTLLQIHIYTHDDDAPRVR